MINLICAGWIPHDDDSSGAASVSAAWIATRESRQNGSREDSPFEAGTLDLLPGCHRGLNMNAAARFVSLLLFIRLL